MARIKTSVPFDMLNLDFSILHYNNIDTQHRDNSYFVHNDVVYEDSIFEIFTEGGSRRAGAWSGERLTVDADDNYTGGRIQLYLQVNPLGYEMWEITDIDLDARDVSAAMRTRDRADDMELIRQALSGNDDIRLSAYDDRAFGMDGNDTIHGNGGNDTLGAGAGNDRLYGGDGNDWLLMDSGNDTLDGGPGRDWVSLAGEARAARIDLAVTGPQDTGHGRDVILNIENIQGGMGRDTLMGNAQDNVIRGGMGDDRILGRQGNDVLEGNQGHDHIEGGLGNDTLRGGLGHDTLRGGPGDDRLDGNQGNDRLFGGLGNDRLFGGLGDDLLEGHQGHDLLNGGPGNDTLRGGLGNDTLVGGQGLDWLTGGPGADIFVFRALDDTSADAWRADMITDFQQGLDRIDLRDIDADTTRAGNNSFDFIGMGALDGAGQMSFRKLDRPGTQNDITQILMDVDGDGRADAIIRLAGLHDLTANDFLL